MTATSRETLRDLGLIAMLPGAMALPTALVALLAGETFALPGLALTALLSLGGGGGLFYRYRRHRNQKGVPSKPAIALAWLLGSLLAAIPFLAVAYTAVPLSATTLAFRDPINALFEAVSGLTSTGLTVSIDPSALPRTLQWWRTLLEWVGGIGVMFVALAVTEPGEEGYARHQDELGEEMSTGGLADRTQRVVTSIWAIYLGYTVLAVVAFWAAGMPLWEALNHGMTGVSTGGFTVTRDSFASYSPTIQRVAVAVMIVGAVSFATHFSLLVRHRLGVLRNDTQTRVLAVGLLFGTLALWGVLNLGDAQGPFFDALFQWVSALGTCGFSIVTVGEWPPPALLVLGVAMFVGGASGSTAGGVKLRRLALLFKGIGWRLRSYSSSRARPYRLDGRTLDEEEAFRRLHDASMLLLLFLITLAVGTLLLMLSVNGRYELSAVVFEAVSAVGTNGLSSGVTSPSLQAPARLLLIAMMWLGRLEVVAVVLLFSAPRLLVRTPEE